MKIKNKDKKINLSQYIWWRDTRILGLLWLIFSLIFLIFSFVEIPFLSSLNGYTFGLLFGYLSPFLYVFFIGKSLLLIFNYQLKLPRWLNLTPKSYIIFLLSIIFIATSTGYYQSQAEIGFIAILGRPWNAFDVWVENYTSYDELVTNPAWAAWFPNGTNGGVVGAFLFALPSTILSGIGTIIVAIVTFLFATSNLFYLTPRKIYRWIFFKEKVTFNEKYYLKSQKRKTDKEEAKEVKSEAKKLKEKKPKKENVDQPEKNISQEVNQNPKSNLKSNKSDLDPFDDPFKD